MHVDLFDNAVHCETDGVMVNLNQLCNAGNAWRLTHGMPIYQLGTFLDSVSLAEYIKAASEVWGIPASDFLTKAGKGKTSRTMAHVSIALLLGEQMSPILHATIHKVFIEDKLLEFREHGGTEFKALNVALDSAMVVWEGRHAHQGHYTTVAKILKASLLDDGQSWSKATVAQTHKRYECEKRLVGMLELGVIRDWEHLKSIIPKL